MVCSSRPVDLCRVSTLNCIISFHTIWIFLAISKVFSELLSSIIEFTLACVHPVNVTRYVTIRIFKVVCHPDLCCYIGRKEGVWWDMSLLYSGVAIFDTFDSTYILHDFLDLFTFFC